MVDVQARQPHDDVLGHHRPRHRPGVLAYPAAPGKSTEEQGGTTAGEARYLGVGRGEFDPVTGLYEWYEGGLPTPKRARSGALKNLTWERLLEQWPLIEADLHDTYGIDVEDGILRRRTWRWLQVRIFGLLSAETRLYRHFAPPPEDSPIRKPRRR
jgi:hypothetical protein